MESNPAVPGRLVDEYADVAECFRVFRHVGFFVFLAMCDVRKYRGSSPMKELDPSMAQQVAQAISVFQEQRTGYPPKAVTVVLSDDTLVVTLHEALSPAEKALSRTPDGAVQVQDYHRQLFKSSVDLLRDEIKRITGVAVGQAAAEVETTTGAVVHAFTTGTMVQVFRLAGRITADTWNRSGSIDQSRNTEGLPC
jgi:uncharacterized protein YbcI